MTTRKILRAMLVLFCIGLSGVGASAQRTGGTSTRSGGTQSELLWQKLEATVQQINRELDGTMGVAIMDLTDGRTFQQNQNHVFAQASSIKVAILAGCTGRSSRATKASRARQN